MPWNSRLYMTLAFLSASAAVAAVMRVPQNQSTIQDGIDTALVGDTVLVDTGVYLENINFNGKNIVVASHFLVTGDTSYISRTVIDGDGRGSVVTFETGEDSSARLSGFHITGGKGGEANFRYYGGGITVIDSSGPHLDHLVISDNTTDIIGGGILCENAAPKLWNVTVARNAAYYDGGGIYCINSSVTLVNVAFKDNKADLGGGVYCENSGVNLSGVTCTGNRASAGGGIYFHSSDATLKNVKVTGNRALRGGGLFLFDSSPLFDTVDRCTIFLNTAAIGSDLYAYYPPVTAVVVDTFTVMNPTSFHTFLRQNFTFDILQAKVEQAESDLYVSPQGDDTHSGLSPQSSLKRVSHALLVILAQESQPRTIFLGEGTYSPSATGEAFPLNVPSFVSLSGESPDQAVLDAEGEGGLINLDHAEGIRLENMTLTGGSAAFGGAIYTSSSSPELMNVMVSDNVAYYQGGGMFCTNSSPTLVNVTMSGNSANFGGALLCAYNSSPVMANAILWNDSPEEIRFFGDQNGAAIFHSDVRGGEDGIVTNGGGTVNWGAGNIVEDPLFAGPDHGDFHLQETSPCIDAGTATLTVEGDTLFVVPDTAYEGKAPDMGALESSYPAGAASEKFLPVEFALHPNYPNPFNAITTIVFSVPLRGRVALTVYDLLGREVRTILNRSVEAGRHELRWDAGEIHSGIYLVRMEAGDFVKTRKAILVR